MNQDFREALSDMITSTIGNLVHTASKSKVNKIEKNFTAQITPDLKITTADNREVPYPKISGTTVIMPYGKNKKVGFAFPVKAGDTGLSLYGEGGSGTDLKYDISGPKTTFLPGLYDEPGDYVTEAGEKDYATVFNEKTYTKTKKEEIETEVTEGGVHIVRGKDFITIDVPQGGTHISITSSSVDVTTSGSVNVTAPAVTVNASKTTVNGQAVINGNVTVNGNETVTGILTAGGKVMNTHTHTCPDGVTSAPL